MKKLLLMIVLLLSPLIIIADEFDDIPSTGEPVWYYFIYQVKYATGDTNTGRIKVCASNAGVALSAGREILLGKYGQSAVKLRFKGKGESCDEERTGEIY